LVKNVVTTIPSFHQSYNGVEVQVNTRLSNATVFGGLTVGRDHGDQNPATGSTADTNNPNNLINNQGAVGYDSTYQIRGGFSYHLPYDVQIAGTIREATGLPQVRNFVVTTSIVPGLTQVTQTVQAAANGDYRYPWQNLVDLRFVKIIRAGSVRIEPTADLFNVFNSSAVVAANTTIGPALGKPSAIVMGRLLRLGAHITF
jgi:hypothetical protein